MLVGGLVDLLIAKATYDLMRRAVNALIDIISGMHPSGKCYFCSPTHHTGAWILTRVVVVCIPEHFTTKRTFVRVLSFIDLYNLELGMLRIFKLYISCSASYADIRTFTGIVMAFLCRPINLFATSRTEYNVLSVIFCFILPITNMIDIGELDIGGIAVSAYCRGITIGVMRAVITGAAKLALINMFCFTDGNSTCILMVDPIDSNIVSLTNRANCG